MQPLTLNSQILIDICHQHDVAKLSLFGSTARGEATKRLSDELRQSQPNIPWKLIAGMRDKLIHHYFGVDLDAVWLTATEDLLALEQTVQSILSRT
jgi:uncharacterized protein with HEPN domain